jgi:hypothetical protein
VAIGAKKVETRSWATNYRGPLAIHASKKQFNTDSYFDRELHTFAYALGLPDIFSFDTLPYGTVIATCKLVDCLEIHGGGEFHVYIGNDCSDYIALPVKSVEYAFGDYTPGRYAWMLEDVRILPEPIPAKGHLGLWEWTPPEGIEFPVM